MSKKLTLTVAILEALVLLVMKVSQRHQNKQNKPVAGEARKAAGRRVVNPSPPRYDDDLPPGDKNAAYLPASGSAADEKIHEKGGRKL